ncbi:MAG: hypothetical protein ACYTGZ_12670 [Planctomycetota bacterium]
MRYLLAPPLALLLAAPASFAGGILRPVGENLGEFKVLLNLAQIDRSTPAALTRSWADLQVEEHEVAARFSKHFKDAHVAILKRFYSPQIQKAQERAYSLDIPAVNGLRCQFVQVKTDEKGTTRGYVRRSWIDAIGRPRSDQAIVTLRKAKDGKWYVSRVAFAEPGGSVTENPRKVPPVTTPINVPKTFPELKDTPSDTFKRVMLEFRLLRFQRRNAQHELNRHVFPLLNALYGPEIAKEERKNQPPAKPREQFFFRAKDPVELETGRVRLGIMALQKAPEENAAIAAGEAAFDMEKDEAGKWRVVAEALASKAGEPMVPVKAKFGIFLMG